MIITWVTGHPKTAVMHTLPFVSGNPWPAIIQHPSINERWINNVLLDSARKNLGHDQVEEAVNHDSKLQWIWISYLGHICIYPVPCLCTVCNMIVKPHIGLDEYLAYACFGCLCRCRLIKFWYTYMLNFSSFPIATAKHPWNEHRSTALLSVFGVVLSMFFRWTLQNATHAQCSERCW